jgi:hypothetical protein
VVDDPAAVRASPHAEGATGDWKTGGGRWG